MESKWGAVLVRDASAAAREGAHEVSPARACLKMAARAAQKVATTTATSRGACRSVGAGAVSRRRRSWHSAGRMAAMLASENWWAGGLSRPEAHSHALYNCGS